MLGYRRSLGRPRWIGAPKEYFATFTLRVCMRFPPWLIYFGNFDRMCNGFRVDSAMRTLAAGDGRYHLAGSAISAGRNRSVPYRPSFLSVHLFYKPAHRAHQRRQFPPFNDRLGGIETMLTRIAIIDSRAGRPAPEYPAAAGHHCG